MLHTKVLEEQKKIINYVKDLGIPAEENAENINILTAFVHKSFASDYKEEYVYNERLEFLGDGILGAVINKLLFLNFPEFTESVLSLYKSALVREETLAEIARDINLGAYVFVSRGEEKMQGRDKASVLSDTFEALIGAIYLDFEYDIVAEFIETYVYSKIEKIKDIDNKPIKSYKTLIQEKIQKKSKMIPEYNDLEHKVAKSGNVEIYKSEIYVNDEKQSEGFGPSKKKAQEEAAKNLWEMENK